MSVKVSPLDYKTQQAKTNNSNHNREELGNDNKGIE